MTFFDNMGGWPFFCLLLVGCSSESTPPLPVQSDSNVNSNPADIVFLTRDGCANTPVLFASFDAAVRTLDGRVEYKVINQATFSPKDPRVGYPTPTILYRGADIFGMREPVPPFSGPT